MFGAVLAVAFVSANALSNEEAWANWKGLHKRSYATEAEERARFSHFVANLATVKTLNDRHASKKNGARFHMNKYADRSVNEQARLRGTRLPDNARSLAPEAKPIVGVHSTDATVDWRTKVGIVQPIQDQAQCGSCWAFSATANMESRWAIARSARGLPGYKLAEQYLVDCEHNCGTYRGQQGCDAGCEGGLMPNAYQYVMAHGQPGEDAYPYAGVDQTCQDARFQMQSRINITSWELVSQNETDIATYVAAKGPVSIAVDASEWTFYWGGVMEYLCWGKTTMNDLDHGVAIVGFGTDGSTPYWIIRNSWGTDWGESGYAKVLRNDGFCGVNLFASSAIV